MLGCSYAVKERDKRIAEVIVRYPGLVHPSIAGQLSGRRIYEGRASRIGKIKIAPGNERSVGAIVKSCWPPERRKIIVTRLPYGIQYLETKEVGCLGCPRAQRRPHKCP